LRRRRHRNHEQHQECSQTQKHQRTIPHAIPPFCPICPARPIPRSSSCAFDQKSRADRVFRISVADYTPCFQAQTVSYAPDADAGDPHTRVYCEPPAHGTARHFFTMVHAPFR
jgi:hypothetical protein